jgi:Fe2+ transport system protein FeoA
MPHADQSRTLEQVHPGEPATLLKLLTESASYRLTLYSMGLLPGTPIKVIRLAPLGDPMQIEVRGSQLTIRKSDARSLLVEAIEGDNREN